MRADLRAWVRAAALIGRPLPVGMAFTMLRNGSRLAWGVLRVVLMVRGSLEVLVHGPAALTHPHTAPPNGVTGTNWLFVYLFA